MWLMQVADFTLTSTTAQQRVFNGDRGKHALLLQPGVYEFDCFLYLLSMSATSGNFGFDVVGAGTAITDRWGQQGYGVDSVSPLAAGARDGSASVTSTMANPALRPAVGTGAVFSDRGLFRATRDGTIIPSITLNTAAAALVKAGSWFMVRRIGEAKQSYSGPWV